MKYLAVLPAILSSVILSVCIPTEEAASHEPHAQAVEHLLALHEVADITNALPEIQTLWPDRSQEYAQCVKHALAALSCAPSNPATTQVASQIFAYVARNSIPTNREDSSSLLRLKCDLILQCLNFPPIRDNISTWLDIADIVGDVRLEIIPNYVPQGQLNPPDVMQAPSQEEARLAVVENQQKVATDRLQQELRVTDRKLTLLLLRNVREVTSRLGEARKSETVERIRSSARLNEDEVRELM